jgi:beta-lactamase class A
MLICIEKEKILMTKLESQIKEVVEKSGATFGIALQHIESGEEVLINADQYFPMASVFKVPILVETCFRLAEGQIRPDDRWTLRNSDKNFPSGVLVFFEEGLTPTIKDLMMFMIIISDNTATDILLNRLGKKEVIDRMRSLGLEHIHITMTVRELFSEIMPDTNPNKPIQELYRMMREGGDEDRMAKAKKLVALTPENNVTTPADMARLFRLIYDGKTPDRQWSDFALDVLFHQQLGDRIPRFLPQGTLVAHKTGTIGPVRNDAGIIYVNEHSHVILSMFVMWQPPAEGDPQVVRQKVFELENAMGEVALLAYKAYQ